MTIEQALQTVQSPRTPVAAELFMAADETVWQKVAEIQQTDTDEATISALTIMLSRAVAVIAQCVPNPLT
jgi:hypothetical protein